MWLWFRFRILCYTGFGFGPGFGFGGLGGMVVKVVFQASWVTTLRANTHGCSKCRKVLDQSHWSTQVVKNHRHFQRDLVCTDCLNNGFSPGRYEQYECQECRLTLGSMKFAKMMLADFKRRGESSPLICEDWNGES